MSAINWLDMLGLGDVGRTLTDPNFQAQVQQFAAAQFDTNSRVRLLQVLVNRIADHLGIEHGDLDAALSAGNGTNGTGKPTAPGFLAHDGSGGPPPPGADPRTTADGAA